MDISWSGEEDDEVLRWKEQRRLTNNLTVHYQRTLYIVENSRAARGQLVEVHELMDGTISIRHGNVHLPATPFRIGGEVRQQDVADNKYLGTILEGLRRTQLAEDERMLAQGRKTKREKAQLSASIERRRTAVR